MAMVVLPEPGAPGDKQGPQSRHDLTLFVSQLHPNRFPERQAYLGEPQPRSRRSRHWAWGCRRSLAERRRPEANPVFPLLATLGEEIGDAPVGLGPAKVVAKGSVGCRADIGILSRKVRRPINEFREPIERVVVGVF